MAVQAYDSSPTLRLIVPEKAGQRELSTAESQLLRDIATLQESPSLDLLDAAKPFLTQQEKKNLLIHMSWLRSNLAQLIDRLEKLPTTD
ncbi:hypothetical protein NZK33_13225 [Cyanobium sp. FGCU-6]|nr:hypothetical protein [Cyanobium sp. FGCU6]